MTVESTRSGSQAAQAAGGNGVTAVAARATEGAAQTGSERAKDSALATANPLHGGPSTMPATSAAWASMRLVPSLPPRRAPQNLRTSTQNCFISRFQTFVPTSADFLYSIAQFAPALRSCPRNTIILLHLRPASPCTTSRPCSRLRTPMVPLSRC